MKNYPHFVKSLFAAFAVLTAFAISAYFEYERFTQQEKQTVETELTDLRDRLALTINSRVWSAYGIKALVETYNDAKKTELNSYLIQLFNQNDSLLRNIAILKDTKIIFIYPHYPNQTAVGIDLATIPGQKESVLKVKNSKSIVINAPVRLVQEGLGIVARVPIINTKVKEDPYWGQISVVLDFEKVFQKIGAAVFMSKCKLAIYEAGDYVEKYKPIYGDNPIKLSTPISIPLKLQGSDWYLAAEPIHGWNSFSHFFVIIVFSGFILALGTAQYVYQHNKSREFLRKSEEKFKTIFFDSADANLLISNFKIIDCNSVTLSLLGCTKEFLIGKTPWEISPELQPDGQESEKKAIYYMKRTIPAQGSKFEWVHKRSNGEEFYVEVVLTWVVINESRVLFTTWRDISERKKTEQELRIMNERLALISQVSNSLIGNESLPEKVQQYSDLIKDVFKIDICIIRILKGDELTLVTCTGIEPERVVKTMKIGFGISGYLMEGKKALAINDLENDPLTRGKTYLVGGLYKGKSYAGAPILIKGKVIGVLGIYLIHEKRDFSQTDLEHLQILANNIAVVIENQNLYYDVEQQNRQLEDELVERRRIEEELKAEKEKADELNRVKSSFFSNMSHELRTPLQAILGYSQVLHQSVEDATLARMAGVIYRSGQRLSNTLKLILEISRLEAAKIKPDNSAVDAKKVVEEAFVFNKNLAEKKNLKIATVYCPETVAIAVDQSLFSEILNLIIDNAIKFTNEGSITLQVQKQGELAKIIIADTGIGIADEKLSVIFDEFRQESEGMGRSYEGTGLGLTLAKKYIELMNGSITVESQLSLGTTFTIYFPLL